MYRSYHTRSKTPAHSERKTISLLVTMKRALELRKHFPQDTSLRTIWVAPHETDPSAIRPHLSISLQSLLRDVGPRLRERMLQSQRFCLFNVSRMHVYVHKVLCGVLYPEAHMKSIKKKKKKRDLHCWRWCLPGLGHCPGGGVV